LFFLQLTDFGLSRVARSVSRCSRDKDDDDGGTLSYMPPEALQSLNYKACKATDVYSYGVLLWSMVTGKEPYEGALSNLVRFRIPQGDRPDLTSIDHRGVKGLEDMVRLMTECWHQDPSSRPSFLEAQPQVSSCVTGPLPKQETAASYTKSMKKGNLSSRDEVTEAFPRPAPPGIRTTQRQSSTPDRPQITMYNVCGVQIGSNNTMNIVQRQRHQTAPSRVSTSHSNSENSQKKPQ
ncbi:hypothetical protein cypCar_00039918, partial [Cyprinus carpio]